MSKTLHSRLHQMLLTRHSYERSHFMAPLFTEKGLTRMKEQVSGINFIVDMVF